MRRTPYPGRLEAYPTRCTDSGLLQRHVASRGFPRPKTDTRLASCLRMHDLAHASAWYEFACMLHASRLRPRSRACMHGSSSFSVPPLGAAHASSCPSILACCPCLRPRAAFLLDNPRCFMHVADRRLLRFFPCYST
jgi:hypothetical protein